MLFYYCFYWQCRHQLSLCYTATDNQQRQQPHRPRPRERKYLLFLLSWFVWSGERKLSQLPFLCLFLSCLCMRWPPSKRRYLLFFCYRCGSKRRDDGHGATWDDSLIIPSKVDGSKEVSNGNGDRVGEYFDPKGKGARTYVKEGSCLFRSCPLPSR